jgi:hypothetical protein
MQPVIQPILRIPLRAEPNGSTWSPRLEIIPAGPTLVIEQPGFVHTWKEVVLWHAPTAAAITLLVCLVWMWCVLLRVRGRPQTSGLLYCRRCNYELAAPGAGFGDDGRARWTGPDGRCSECGATSDPVKGRPRLSRLVLPALALGPLALACAGVMALTLEPLSRFGGTPWPAPFMGKVLGGLSLQHRTWDRTMVHRLYLWDLPGREDLGVQGPFVVYGMGNAGITPDGRRFVYVTEPTPSPGWSMPVVVADLATGRQLTVLHEREEGVTRGVIGMSADGREAYVQTYHFGAGPNYRETLEAVDLASVRARELADVPWAYSVLPGGSRQAANQRFVVDDAGHWAMLSWGNAAPGPSMGVQVTVPGEEGLRTFTVSLPASSSLEPRSSGAGASVDVAIWPGATTWRIDLKSGTAQVLPSAAGVVAGRSRDGRFELRSQTPNLAMIDTSTGAVVAQLGLAGGTFGSGAAISTDGRWAACVVGLPGMSGQAVLVWDLGAGPPMNHDGSGPHSGHGVPPGSPDRL